MHKIYCLIDPFTNDPFYVGATKIELKRRLIQHISTSTTMRYYTNENSIMDRRSTFLRDIRKRGGRPYILLLINVESDKVDQWERHYYNILTKNGIELMQHPHRFTYQGHYCIKNTG